MSTRYSTAVRTPLPQPLRGASGLSVNSRRGSWSRRTMILLVMQTLPGSLSLNPWRVGNRLMLTTRQAPQHPNPTFIPAANRAAEVLAVEIGGVAQSNLREALLNTPAFAHIVGGAVIGAGPEHGVVDRDQQAFRYRNLLSATVGGARQLRRQPSLTITALAEHTMSHVPYPSRLTTSSTSHTQATPRHAPATESRPPAPTPFSSCRRPAA